MYSLLFLGFASFVLSLFLTPFLRDLALRFGFVDEPDGHRKIHQTPIPRVGGVAILIAAIGSYALLLIVRLSAGNIVRAGLPFALKLLPAVIIIFIVGLIDDIVGISAWKKLIAQVGVALIAWSVGIRLESIGGHPFHIAVSLILTILWIVACTNAVNLIDGVDGLAAGVGLFAAFTTLIAGLLHQNIDLVFATAPLAGALLGFLRYNFNPASIFLGDCGSLTIGFLLGCYGIAWSEKSTTLLGMTAPLLALSVPLLDSGIAIARRFLRQQPIFSADRSHIHHKLLSRGLTPRRVVLVLYGFCGLAAIASLMLTATHKQYQDFVIVLVCLVAWLGLQHLGYHEFGVARRLVLGGGFRRMVNAQLALISIEQELAASTSVDQCWGILREAAPRFGFSGIELNLDRSEFHGDFDGRWHIHVELPGHGYINLIRNANAADSGSASILFVECVARVFNQKLNELRPEQANLKVYASAD